MTPAPLRQHESHFHATGLGPGSAAPRLAAASVLLTATVLLLAISPTAALAFEDRDYGPNPATPVIGISPDELDFSRCLEPGSECEEGTFDLFNDVDDPASMLEVIEILVAGTGYTLLGPQPPFSIPGDGTRITYTVRFCPDTGLPTPGAITVSARLAANSPRVLSMSGDGNLPPACDAGGPYVRQLGLPVVFDGSDSEDPDPEGQIVSYTWDFGDGSTGTGVQPSHTYQAVGVYPVLLSVTDDCGAAAACSTSALISVGNQAPICDAGGPYSGFTGVPIHFDGTASSDPDGFIATYSWTFGDGSAGGGPTPFHIYPAAGTYLVTLRVTDNGGRSTTCETEAVVAFNAPPVCDHGGPYFGIVGAPIQFDGTGSFDPDGLVVFYHWSFGDGETSTLPSPQHAYSATGTYDVILTVRDDRNAQIACITTASVEVNATPVCDAGGPYLAVVNAPIHFDGTGSFDPDGTIVGFEWAFGDGATGAGPTPIHSYAAAGDYTVQLCVRDNAGATACCTTLARVLEGGTPLSPVIGVDPEILDFGNCADIGTPVDLTIDVFNDLFDPTSILHLTSAVVTGSDFALIGGPALPVDIPGDGSRVTFTLRFTPPGPDLAVGTFDLTAPGAANTPRSVPLRGRANVPPQCDAGGPYQGITGEPILFDGTGSSDPGGTALDFRWDFGDGQTATGATPSHIYTAAGTFQVVLTLTDNCGAITACETTATVLGRPICHAGGPYQGLPGIPVQFNGTGSSDPDGVIVSYDWDFGDGGSGTGPTPTHTYNSAGFFLVRLTVTDDDSLTSTCQTQASIGGATPVEISSFRAAPHPHSVEITWRFLADGHFSGFELWRRERAGDTEIQLHDGLLTDDDRDGAITFTDTRVQAGAGYDYILVAVERDGTRERIGPLPVVVPFPALALRIAPNPSRPPIAMSVDLPQAGPVRVWIADATGRIVRELADEYRPAGTHALAWDGRDGRGISAASGIYFMVLERGADVRRVKLVLVR
jgi:PKD repeat protein